MPAAPQQVLTVQAEPVGQSASVVQPVAVSQLMPGPHQAPKPFALVKQKQLAVGPHVVNEPQVVPEVQPLQMPPIHGRPAAQQTPGPQPSWF